MGWTSYEATHYKNGKIDRKEEINARFTQVEHDGSDYNGGICHYPKMKIIKSTMKGSTWYGVIEVTNSVKGTVERFAEVVLTSTNWNDGMNFGYKEIGSYGSGNYDFPISYFKLLDDPDCGADSEWRQKCIDKTKQPKLSDLSIGTRIRFTRYNGDVIECYKHAPGYQFKRPFWMRCDGSFYVKANQIPNNYEVVGTM